MGAVSNEFAMLSFAERFRQFFFNVSSFAFPHNGFVIINFVTHCISVSCRYWFTRVQHTEATMFNLTSKKDFLVVYMMNKKKCIQIAKVKHFTKNGTHTRHFA